MVYALRTLILIKHVPASLECYNDFFFFSEPAISYALTQPDEAIYLRTCTEPALASYVHKVTNENEI